MKKFFFEMTAQEALTELKSDLKQGLSEGEARSRLNRMGANRLENAKQESTLKLLLNQFTDPLVLVLLLAAAMSWYLKDMHTAWILVVIVAINALIGFYQEYSVERILDELRKIIRGKAVVLRQGMRLEIEQQQLVPGDIVYLEEGSAILADARLLQSNFLSTNDFILTGESVPQEKDANLVCAAETSVSDQNNLVFMGTTVAKGHATAVVIATGMHTEVGNIASSAQTIEQTPSSLQREIAHIAQKLLQIAGWIAILIFATNLLLTVPLERILKITELAWQGELQTSLNLALSDTALMQAINGSILFAISVAAACVPQGLPAQITVALSLGVRRMAKRNAVVKKLSAVETLGSTTVICTDKTGTLTKNEMTITRCFSQGREFCVTGTGYSPAGTIMENDTELRGEPFSSLQTFFTCGFLAGNGRVLPPDSSHTDWHAIGDPTEAAFTPLLMKAGFKPDALEQCHPVLFELPFDSNRKRMTVYRQKEEKVRGFMKGGLSSVLSCCDRIADTNAVRPLSPDEAHRIEALGEHYAKQSLRVIALAYQDLDNPPQSTEVDIQETGFVFLGFVCMLDPPREGTYEAIAACYAAKIRVMMITGDNRFTAAAIAEQIGMKAGPGQALQVISGEQIKMSSDIQLMQLMQAQSVVFARVSAADKLRLVSILKNMGEVVAVTGDGVNDTLSLKNADIGVAMGKSGSEVAKEAAGIILLDDDFSTLSQAIREGRTIFANLRKTVLGNIAANLGELTTVLIGFGLLTIGIPYPISAVQVLAVDLLGEILPLTALTLDPSHPSLMQDAPRKQNEHILNWRSFANVTFFGIVMGALAYWSFYQAYSNDHQYPSAQAAAYLAIILGQLANLIGARSNASIFSRYTFTNAAFWSSIIISLLLVCLLIYSPIGQEWFKFGSLAQHQLFWPISSLFIMLSLHEIRKLSMRSLEQIREKREKT